MADAESDVSCIPATQPSAPHQLPQPSVRSCNPGDDNGVENMSWYDSQMHEALLEALIQESESDGELTVTWKKKTRNSAAPLSASAFPELALAHRVVKLVSHKQRPIHMPSLTLALLRLMAKQGKTKL